MRGLPVLLALFIYVKSSSSICHNLGVELAKHLLQTAKESLKVLVKIISSRNILAYLLLSQGGINIMQFNHRDSRCLPDVEILILETLPE